MVHIEDGDPPKKVPLVYYDKDGMRHVVGDADVTLRDGTLTVLGHYENTPGATEIPGMNLECFSIDAQEIKGSDIHVASDLEPTKLHDEALSAFQRYQRKGLSG